MAPQASTDPASAAAVAAEQSGLPAPFLQALIQEEGTLPLGSNNPFDITATWANDTGFGASVVRLWNSVGVGVFSSVADAIASWAKGIATFPAYERFRLDAAKGSSPYQLALDLQNAGYAGNSSNFATNIASIYESITGLSGYSKMQPSDVQTAGVSAQAAAQSPTPTGGELSYLASIYNTFAPPTKASNPLEGINNLATSVTNEANALTTIPTAIASAVASVERIFWIVIGLVIALAGIWLLVQDNGS